MFIGSINRYMRDVLKTAAEGWKGCPVYVACSGNFTVERSSLGAALGHPFQGRAVLPKKPENPPIVACLDFGGLQNRIRHAPRVCVHARPPGGRTWPACRQAGS